MATVANMEEAKKQMQDQALVEKKEHLTIDKWINTMSPEIQRALPKMIGLERFVRTAITAVSVNPKLSQCTPKSFMSALMTSAQLGLEINTPLGYAYLIPYDKKQRVDGEWKVVKTEAQFQLGYQGLIELAYRTDKYEMVYAHEVRENDEFEWELGMDKKLIHKPAKSNRGKVIGYYACYRLKSGVKDFEYMTIQEMVDHRNQFSPASKSGKESPWDNNFDQMAKKTVLKQVLKYAPKAAEFARQLTNDETIKEELLPDMTDARNVLQEDQNNEFPDAIDVDAEVIRDVDPAQAESDRMAEENRIAAETAAQKAAEEKAKKDAEAKAKAEKAAAEKKAEAERKAKEEQRKKDAEAEKASADKKSELELRAKLIQRIHIIMHDMIKLTADLPGHEYTEEVYRAEMRGMFGCESTKDLDIDQLGQLVASMNESLELMKVNRPQLLNEKFKREANASKQNSTSNKPGFLDEE